MIDSFIGLFFSSLSAMSDQHMLPCRTCDTSKGVGSEWVFYVLAFLLYATPYGFKFSQQASYFWFAALSIVVIFFILIQLVCERVPVICCRIPDYTGASVWPCALNIKRGISTESAPKIVIVVNPLNREPTLSHQCCA